MFQGEYVFHDSSTEWPTSAHYVPRVDVLVQVLRVPTDPGAGPPALGLDLLQGPLLLWAPLRAA